MLYISTKHLIRIENGAIRPRLTFIEKTCQIFNIDEAVLMLGNKKKIANNKELYQLILELSVEKKFALITITKLLK